MFWKLPGFGRISEVALRPPAPREDRHGLAVVVTVKNEGRHVEEWARFHVAAGIRACIAYDDGSIDATIPTLRNVLGGSLTVVPWTQRLHDGPREIHNQVLAYAHAVANFGQFFRWMAFIDVDEFLIPKAEKSLPDALRHLEGCRNISLPWHMFGHCGHETPPERGVLRSYLRRAADPMSDERGVRAFKCIVDPCHVTALKVHSVETDGNNRTCNDAGMCVPLSERSIRAFYSAGRIQLNHYYARSRAEVAEKIARGHFVAAMQPRYAHKVQRTILNIERQVIEDRTALDFLARIGDPELVPQPPFDGRLRLLHRNAPPAADSPVQ